MKHLRIKLQSSITHHSHQMDIEGYQPTPAGMAEALRIMLNGGYGVEATIVDLPLEEMTALELLAHLGGMAASRRWRHAMEAGESYAGTASVEAVA